MKDEIKTLIGLSYQRFLILLKCLRFDNIANRAQKRQLGKQAQIRVLTDQFTGKRIFDEKLEPFRGRYGFRQYLPNKPNKYGLKVFALVDAKNYYCANFEAKPFK